MSAAESAPGATTVAAANDVPRRTRRVFWIALAASLGVHVVWTLWPAAGPREIPEPVLTATLEVMPPPAASSPATESKRVTPTTPPAMSKLAASKLTAPKPATPKPATSKPATSKPAASRTEAAAPKDARRPPVVASPVSTVAVATPVAKAGSETDDATKPLAQGGAGNAARSGESRDDAAGTGDGASDGEAIAAKLPPRVDLAYQVFLGTRGFMIGDATYRFERDGDRYRISTVGQARGLAALFIHGTGKVESRGVITAAGLKPYEFAIERGSPDKREIAFFDWAGETVSLNDGHTALLEAPAFDPLTVLWQPYFSPPGSATELTFSLATTRKVARYTLTRDGGERVAWHGGTIETERWRRVSDDGKTEAWFWLAPSLHFIPVRMRATRTSRGTLEAKLASIRVDADYAGFASDPAGPVPPPPPESRPVNPFPDMTP